MSLTATEEALVRQLLDQQAAILSLAGNEATITSKLGATKVTLADLVAASTTSGTDLLLTRQGTEDKSLTLALLSSFVGDGKVDIAGDTMAGPLVLNADPTLALGAATKKYVDLMGKFGLFYKVDPETVLFTKTGNGTASIKACKIDVAGKTVEYTSVTAITMPALTNGTDYAVWVKDDATIQASANFTSPPGAGNWRKIGGFHYAPGGNAAAQTGGNTTPQINEYSFWDLKFRPAAIDPRGMTLVAGGFWADIYFTGVDHLTNGTSKYNVTMADGSSPPKIPTKFGGTGTNAYASMNWWEAAEVLKSHGKRLPTYSEFSALAYGSTEASSVGTDQVSTILNAAYTSRWGVIQATGVLWTWGDEFSYRQDGSATPWNWRAVSGGRGSLYLYSDTALVAAVFGGGWNNGSDAGSRCSYWGDYPWYSYSNIGARGVCDHLKFE